MSTCEASTPTASQSETVLHREQKSPDQKVIGSGSLSSLGGIMKCAAILLLSVFAVSQAYSVVPSSYPTSNYYKYALPSKTSSPYFKSYDAGFGPYFKSYDAGFGPYSSSFYSSPSLRYFTMAPQYSRYSSFNPYQALFQDPSFYKYSPYPYNYPSYSKYAPFSYDSSYNKYAPFAYGDNYVTSKYAPFMFDDAAFYKYSSFPYNYKQKEFAFDKEKPVFPISGKEKPVFPFTFGNEKPFTMQQFQQYMNENDKPETKPNINYEQLTEILLGNNKNPSSKKPFYKLPAVHEKPDQSFTKDSSASSYLPVRFAAYEKPDQSFTKDSTPYDTYEYVIFNPYGENPDYVKKESNNKYSFDKDFSSKEDPFTFIRHLQEHYDSIVPVIDKNSPAYNSYPTYPRPSDFYFRDDSTSVPSYPQSVYKYNFYTKSMDPVTYDQKKVDVALKGLYGLRHDDDLSVQNKAIPKFDREIFPTFPKPEDYLQL